MKNILRAIIFVTISLFAQTMCLAQTKIDSTVEQLLAKSSKIRVIILTRADPAMPGGGRALSAPASYLGEALGDGASKVKQLGALSAASAEIDANGLERLRNDPNVDKVVADVPVPPSLDKSVPFIGADKLHALGLTGTGLSVAVLDTGIDAAHPALNGAVSAQACFSTTAADYPTASTLCPNGLGLAIMPSAAQGCPAELRGCVHGTHVAGIIAGRHMVVAGQPEFGGVAPAAKIVAVQVFTKISDPDLCRGLAACVLSFPSDQLRALEWVYKNRSKYNIASVNMSLGGGYYDNYCDNQSALTEMIERLFAKGVVTAIAAGNDSYYDGVSMPGCISAAVTVAGLARDGSLDVSYTDVAPQVDIAAPGTAIVSAIPAGKYEALTGTSMATPHVAAAWALLRQAYQGESGSQLLKRLIGLQTVSDPRTDRKVAMLHLDAPAQGVKSFGVTGTGQMGSSSGVETATQVPVGQDFILQSGPGTDQSVASAVQEACKSLLLCNITKIGPTSWRLKVNPVDSVRSPENLLQTEDMKAIIAGKNVKIYDNTPALAMPKQ